MFLMLSEIVSDPLVNFRFQLAISFFEFGDLAYIAFSSRLWFLSHDGLYFSYPILNCLLYSRNLQYKQARTTRIKLENQKNQSLHQTKRVQPRYWMQNFVNWYLMIQLRILILNIIHLQVFSVFWEVNLSPIGQQFFCRFLEVF